MRERGRAVDVEGFDAAMAAQKARARASWAGSGETRDAAIWFDLAEAHGATEFLGYDTETAEGQILAVLQGGRPVDAAAAGAEVQVVVNQTPFYAESGGQVGDAGRIETDTGVVEVSDTRRSNGVFVHAGRVLSGTLTQGQPARLEVDHVRRARIARNHSATHLLNEALRNALGPHVAQRGSLNAPDRLRFDFSHATALSPAELVGIAAEVNGHIRANGPVETRVMTPDDARAIGAQALFGEKYGDEVRVVAMGSDPRSGKGFDANAYSLELCGGTHVARLGEIGLCVILGDSASSAGVRRIEALTGEGALAYVNEELHKVAEVAAVLKAQPDAVVERVRTLVEDRRALQNEVAQLRREAAMAAGAAPAAREIAGVRFLRRCSRASAGATCPVSSTR